MNTLIVSGEVVSAVDRYKADIYIENERIALIGNNLLSLIHPDKTIDATGCYILPGAIDPHVHLDMPFMGTKTADDFRSGSSAALFGGTTSLIDFAIQAKGASLHDTLDIWSAKAEGKSLADFGFHLAITDFNEKVKAELAEVILNRGVPSFKAFMAYKGALMIDDRQMFELMTTLKKLGGLLSAHATNGDLIDHFIAKYRSEGKLDPVYHLKAQNELTEEEATGRFIDLARLADYPVYIVHLTCEGAMNRVREATKRNQKVFVETCPQYLLLDASLYEKGFEGAKWVMSPPLRKEKDRETLWAGIAQGLIQVVGTDHCSFNIEQKRMGEKDFSKIPNGLPGIEHRLELLYSEGVTKGRIDLHTLVAICSTNPAKIFGLFPKKGSIAVGADADLVIFDPKKEQVISKETHHHRCDYSAYEGFKIVGKAKTVLLRGTVAVENGRLMIDKGFGRYLPRSTNKS